MTAKQKQSKIARILDSHRTGEPFVMGILNVTPDSFSDGGDFSDTSSALDHAHRMLDEGADIIDIGAESTRPGSSRVSPQQQIERLGSIIAELAKTPAVISIDTTSSLVAEFALENGADIINDISASTEDPAILKLAADRHAPIILMHMADTPENMQKNPHYENVVTEVRGYLNTRINAAVSAGVKPQDIIVDPGIGFGKLLEHNIALLSNIDELAKLGCCVLVGPSRKKFIGDIIGESDPKLRTAGTIAACLESFSRGATIFRVHDVKPLVDALKIASALQRK